MIRLRRCCHGNSDIALVIKYALINCHNFLLYAGGGGIKIFILQKVICYMQLGSREGLASLSSKRIGWSLMTRSIQDVLQCLRKCVGSSILSLEIDKDPSIILATIKYLNNSKIK